jgi:hypothetical protein
MANERPAAATPQQSLQIRYVDLPDLRETFADSIHTMVWDGQALRVEFCVARFADPAAQAEAQRYPACRLVLSAAAAADLANRLQQTMAALRGAAPAAAAPEQRKPS